MTAPVVPVPFHDHQILTIQDGDTIRVVMKPIVKKLGLDWEGQRQRINRNPVLRKGACMIQAPSAGGSQDGLTLPLDLFHGWLVTLDASRVRDPERQQAIIRYQEESFEAIHAYWHKGRAENPRAGKALGDLRRQALSLMDRLKNEGNPALRRSLHAMLSDVMTEMGHPTPPLDSMGREIPGPPDILKPFWNAITALEQRGYAINHSKDPVLLAVNLPDLRDLFENAGVAVPITPDLKQALKLSTIPRFVAAKAVSSRLKKQAVKCWVFRR